MMAVINSLEHLSLPATDHPHLGPCTMSLNTLHGGKALNVIPDRCKMGLDIRTLPGQDATQIIRDIEHILKELHKRNTQFEASVSVVRRVGALETHADHPFVREVCEVAQVPEAKAVGFTTDAPSVVPLGAPVLIYGPGRGSVCHQPDETIALADVDRAVAQYELLIRRFLT
jgi:succinyl-diaminopimelate desuccinylase